MAVYSSPKEMGLNVGCLGTVLDSSNLKLRTTFGQSGTEFGTVFRQSGNQNSKTVFGQSGAEL